MMDLQHHRLPSVGEAVDQGDPPQWPTPIQVLGGQVGTGSAEFLRPTRLRQIRMVEVISELEARILDEHRMGQAERNSNDSPPECWELVEPGGEAPVQVLKGEGTASACPEQPEDNGLHRLFGHLQAQKPRIYTAEPTHGWLGRRLEAQGSAL